MEGAETAAGAAAMTEFAPKRLARQLDFTPALRGPVQQLAVQQPSPVPSVQPVIQRLAHPVARPPLSTTVTLPESPRSQPQAAVLEVKDGTPKKQKQCNCKNSRCLKLYCECFASGIYCDGCNCLNCHNNVDHESTRQEAVAATLERNPNAFRPKVANSPHGSRVGKQEVGPAQVVKHNKGCNCKKSGCLKKYCECFQANVLCSDNCKCLDCKNFEGSTERHTLIHGNSYNSMVYQTTNAAINGAINGAIGTSAYKTSPVSKKRKNQENVIGMYQNPRIFHNGQHTQGNHLKRTTSSFPSMPSTLHTHGQVAQVASKVTYRSLLASVIQPQDVKELCSLLVLVSREAANTISDKNVNSDAKEVKNQVETSCCMTLDEKINDQRAVRENVTPFSVSNTQQTVRMCADGSGLDESDLQNKRPASPGTMALMCYEQDADLMEGGPRRPAVISQNIPSETSTDQESTESYMEQERVVLTKFRDYLNRLITRGSIKETMCSSLARCETETDAQPLRNDGFRDGQLGNTFLKPVAQTAKHTPARANGIAFGLNNPFALNIGLPVESSLLRSKTKETVKQC